MKTATECPTNHLLKALTLGQLSSEDSEALFQHISDCDLCRSELETVEDGGDSLIASLRDPVEFANFSTEPDCRLAVVKALGALAISESGRGFAEFDRMPKTIGEYEVVRPIGSGGMGNVFLARHTKLGREVALKVLASHRLADSRTVERFEAEMRAVGRLSHPNIVTAYDARDVEGTAVLVTEFVSGLDLGQLLQRNGALKVADACEIARQVAVALAYTNSQGFVHRDIKPSNVMLSDEGEIKLLDLGLARLQYRVNERTELTGTGQAMGTADYVAPEQVTDSKTVDIRADIYALGCTLFKLLTGRAPFADERHVTSFAKMTAHVSETPASLSALLPDIPRSLAQLVDSMLAKKPADRPATPQDVAVALSPHCKTHDLKKLITDALRLEPRRHPIGSNCTSAELSSQSWMKRKVPIYTAIAAGFLGMMLGVCLSIIIVITNPDGTKTVLHLAEGSKVEISDGNSNISDGGDKVIPGQTLGLAPNNVLPDSDVTPLSFSILANRESTGHSPMVTEPQILEATRLLRASDGSKPVRTPFGTWYAIAGDELGAPIKEMNAGKSFVLVSDQHSIRWPSVSGHVMGMMTTSDSINLNLDEELASAFAKLTKQNIRNQLAIIVNGQIRSAPIINSEIGRNVSITGIFYAGEAKQLGQWLHGGLVDPLPTQSTPIAAGITPASRIVMSYMLPSSKFAHANRVIKRMFQGDDTVNIAADEPSGSLVVFATAAQHEKVTEIFHGILSSLKHDELESNLQALELEYAQTRETVGVDHPAAKSLELQMKQIRGYLSKLSPATPAPQPKTEETKLVDLKNNLRLIGLSFLNFEAAYGKFPGTANTHDVRGITNAGKKIYPFSWRVAILPWIEEQELYELYHFDEPWDSKHNSTLLDKMPAIYRSPFAAPDNLPPGQTNILGFESKESALGTGDGETMVSFTDGIANTLLLVEADCTVPWTKPQDIPRDASQALFFDDHPFTYLMVDGSVNSGKKPTDDVLNKMISRNGGEVFLK